MSSSRVYQSDVSLMYPRLEPVSLNAHFCDKHPLRTNYFGPMTRNNSNQDPNQGDDGNETGLVTKTRPKVKKPSLYRVLLLNDDYTPMEFVVHVLEKYFNKGQEEAMQIMLHVHQNGVGICGTFTYEIAETKVTQVIDSARRNQHPLQCTMEKE
jgi:ATP-dependent Clp protease adaptor protein ClpS